MWIGARVAASVLVAAMLLVTPPANDVLRRAACIINDEGVHCRAHDSGPPPSSTSAHARGAQLLQRELGLAPPDRSVAAKTVPAGTSINDDDMPGRVASLKTPAGFSADAESASTSNSASTSHLPPPPPPPAAASSEEGPSSNSEDTEEASPVRAARGSVQLCNPIADATRREPRLRFYFPTAPHGVMLMQHVRRRAFQSGRFEPEPGIFRNADDALDIDIVLRVPPFPNNRSNAAGLQQFQWKASSDDLASGTAQLQYWQLNERVAAAVPVLTPSSPDRVHVEPSGVCFNCMMKRSEATLVGALSTPALRRQFPRFERTSVENSFYRLAEINHETNVTFSDVLAREAERHEAAVETGKPSLRRLICHALPSFKFCRTEVAWPSPVADSRRNQGSESDEQALANSRPHSSRRLPVLVQPESAPLLSRYVMSSLAWSAGARLVHTATFVAFSAAYRLEVSPLTAFLPVDSAPFVTSVEFGHKVEIAVQIHAPLSTLLASLPAWTLVVPDLPEYSANAASRGRAMSPDEILVDVLTRSLSRDADALEQFSLLCQGCDVSANLSFVAWNDKKQPTNKLDTCQAYLASSGGDLQRLAEMPVSLATMGRQTACAVAVSDVSLADLATYVQLLLHSSQSQRKQLPAQVISVTVAETRDSGLLVSTLAVSTTTCMLGGLGSPRSLISNMFFHNLLASFNVLLLGFVLYLFGGYLLAQLARTSTRVRGILSPRGASVIQVIPAMPTFYFITLRPLSRFFSQLFDGSAPTNLEDAERRQRARVEMERRNQPQAHVNPLEVLVRDPAILVHAAVVADVAVEAPSIDNGAVSANSGTTNELPESNAAPRNDNDATSHNETASVLESDVVAVAPAAEHALQVSEADPRSLPSNRSNPPDSPALAIIRQYGPSLTISSSPRQRPQSPQELELD